MRAPLPHRSDELSGAAAEAEARAAAAEQQRAAAEAALAEAQASSAAQASALTSKYEPQLEELRQAAAAAAQGADAAKRWVGVGALWSGGGSSPHLCSYLCSRLRSVNPQPALKPQPAAAAVPPEQAV